MVAQTFTYSINIDSAYRSTEKQTIFGDNIYQLPPNPLEFKNDSNLINISLSNSTAEFAPDDKVRLNGAICRNVTLRNAVTIVKGSLFARIEHKSHGMMIPQETDLDAIASKMEFELIELESCYIASDNKYLDLTVTVTSAMEEIAGTRNVYLIFEKKGEMFVLDHDRYLIALDVCYDGDIIVESLVTIKYNNLYGIPLTEINTDLIVTKVLKDGLVVRIKGIATVLNSSLNSLIDNLISSAGGFGCTLRKIKTVIPAYPNPNLYTIYLDKTYTNIIQSRIVGTSFPNINARYVYIVCPELSRYPFQNTKNVSNAISIVRFKGKPNYVIDTFVPMTQSYDSPIYNLNRLHIEIRLPNGELAPFDKCSDHSFVIELTEIYNRPYETDINTKINAEIRLNNS